MWKSIDNFINESAVPGTSFVFAGIHSQEDETGKAINFNILQLKVKEVVFNPWTKEKYVMTFESALDGSEYIADQVVAFCSSYCTFEDFTNEISGHKVEEAPKIRTRV